MKKGLIWFRNDLRLFDNPALHYAAQENDQIISLYLFDTFTMERRQQIGDAQAWWLLHSLKALKKSLSERGIHLIIETGDSIKILLFFIRQHHVDCIYWNRVYEPQAILRDKKIKQILHAHGVEVQEFNGSLLTEPESIRNKQGEYFKVFSPYWRYCLAQLQPRKIYPIPGRLLSSIRRTQKSNCILEEMIQHLPKWSNKFSQYWKPGEKDAQGRWQDFIKNKITAYAPLRDFPGKQATSGLSASLHFGEISVNQIYHEINQCLTNQNINLHSLEKFMIEIGWREFSYYLLYHFPNLPDTNFNQKFNAFPWHHNIEFLKKWQKAKTGYPIIDAGMRELWETGIMHNRVRMIVASFLIKDLLIDWREGERWFWNTLVDADLANNSASWQWVAGSGADAAPFFRIFNPILQSQKFDPQGEYIKKWLPELKELPHKLVHNPWMASGLVLKNAGVILGKNYPFPLIDHGEAYKKALKIYKKLNVNKLRPKNVDDLT